MQALCRRGALYEEMCRAAKGGVVSIRLPKRNLGTEGALRTHPKANYYCTTVLFVISSSTRLAAASGFHFR
jgi:hypothetical protein